MESVYRCPEDDRRGQTVWSYGQNVWFELTPQETGELSGVARGPTYHRLSAIPSTSRTVLTAEIETAAWTDHVMAHLWYFGGEPEVTTLRHRSAANFLWVDGHVSTATLTETFEASSGVDRWDPSKAGIP